MPASKVVDESEVRRWYDEGRTYAYMVEQYRDRYGLEVVGSMFSNLRSRRGWERRIERDDDLIPWAVQLQHRWQYPVAMLRVEARRRAGRPLSPDEADRLDAWKAGLGDRVVSYGEEGFSYVSRRPDLDLDLIRVPERKTTLRRNADR